MFIVCGRGQRSSAGRAGAGDEARREGKVEIAGGGGRSRAWVGGRDGWRCLRGRVGDGGMGRGDAGQVARRRRWSKLRMQSLGLVILLALSNATISTDTVQQPRTPGWGLAASHQTFGSILGKSSCVSHRDFLARAPQHTAKGSKLHFCRGTTLSVAQEVSDSWQMLSGLPGTLVTARGILVQRAQRRLGFLLRPTTIMIFGAKVQH